MTHHMEINPYDAPKDFSQTPAGIWDHTRGCLVNKLTAKRLSKPVKITKQLIDKLRYPNKLLPFSLISTDNEHGRRVQMLAHDILKHAHMDDTLSMCFLICCDLDKIKITDDNESNWLHVFDQYNFDSPLRFDPIADTYAVPGQCMCGHRIVYRYKFGLIGTERALEVGCDCIKKSLRKEDQIKLQKIHNQRVKDVSKYCKEKDLPRRKYRKISTNCKLKPEYRKKPVIKKKLISL